MPAAVRDEAERLEFPLFEVPYAMPFIAITEKAFTRLVNEQYEILQRGIALQRRLEQLVLEERGIDEVARALSACDRRGGGDPRGAGRRARVGDVPARHADSFASKAAREPRSRSAPARDATPFEPSHEPVAGRRPGAAGGARQPPRTRRHGWSPRATPADWASSSA